MLRGAREVLRRGASQVKLMAGGGVASNYDPLDVTQYTVREMPVAVEAAENWGTYVTVHAYTPRAVRAAIEAGVRCIEHGQLLDEETVALMAEQDIWWCLQPFLDDEDYATTSRARPVKFLQMVAGTDNAYQPRDQAPGAGRLRHRHAATPGSLTRQGAQLAKLTRWYSPADLLRAGNRGQRRAAGAVRAAQPLPRTCRGGGSGRHRRPDPPSTATRWPTSR